MFYFYFMLQSMESRPVEVEEEVILLEPIGVQNLEPEKPTGGPRPITPAFPMSCM